jgi:hypothetical protein
MDKIKEDMENGLFDDKEKLKFLALMGSQVFKVFSVFSNLHFRFLFFFPVKFLSSETSKSFKKRQDHHTVDQTLRKLGDGPPKGRRWYGEEEDISQLYRRGIEDASIIIVGSRKAKNIKLEIFLRGKKKRHKLKTPRGKKEMFNNMMHLWLLSSFSHFSQNIIHLCDKLDFFWMRFNRTRIDCVCLKEEKLSLQKQNKDLKVKLKHYLVHVNMTNGQPAQKNERFANRPSSMKIERVEHIAISAKNQLIKKSKQDRRPVTCIDANLCNAVRHMKLTSAMPSGGNRFVIENKL